MQTDDIWGPWNQIEPGLGRDVVSRQRQTIEPTIFREYDVRGQVTDSGGFPEVSDSVAGRLGRAFGTLLSRRGQTSVVVGFDSRSYSYNLANAFSLGVLSTGIDVTFIGLSTTPLLYYAQQVNGCAGVCITASHNPNGWAGFKLSFEPGTTLGPNDILEFKGVVDGDNFVTGCGTYSEKSVVNSYIELLSSKLQATKPLRVAIDGGNSVSGPLALLTLRAAGHDVHAINEQLDWDFPNHEPDPENLQARMQISEAVVSLGCDVGLSFDGDGDRLGVTDELGNIVWSDRILTLLALDVLVRHPGAEIIYDVKCSRIVPENIEKAGGRPFMWKTGHSHIKLKMRERAALFAGERSGHFFDSADYFGYDDGLYAGLRLLKILGGAVTSLSELVSDLGSYASTPTMQVVCPDHSKYKVVDEFSTFADSIGAKEIIRINGVRAEFDDGWILVRASSNLPALVLVAEAESESRLKELYGLLREGLVDSGLVGGNWQNDPWQLGAE